MTDRYWKHVAKRRLASRILARIRDMTLKKSGKMTTKSICPGVSHAVFVWGDIWDHGLFGGIGRNVPYLGLTLEAKDIADAMAELDGGPSEAEVAAEEAAARAEAGDDNKDRKSPAERAAESAQGSFGWQGRNR